MSTMDSEERKELLKLIKDFYKISGQRTAVFDKDFNVILEYPEHNPYCAEIRKSEEGCGRCHKWDRYGLEHTKELEDYFIYRCHANLLEVCAPIKDNFEIMGYLMFGQLALRQNYAEQRAESLEKCAELIPDPNKRAELFESVKQTDLEYLTACADILLTCASYIRLKELMTSVSNPLWSQIREYVDSRFTEHFSLKNMAKDLHISVAAMCNTAKSCSGRTIMQLITANRIRLAKKYLQTTDFTVSEIASLVGIGDYNYFSRLFKRWTGLTPSKYRAGFHHNESDKDPYVSEENA